MLVRLWRRHHGLPRPLWVSATLVAVCAGAIALAPQPFWENNLSALTPVPAELLARDRALRAELGVADSRQLLVVEAATADAALEALEALDPELERAVAAAPSPHLTTPHATFRPSHAAARAAQLPDAATLRAELDTALLRTPFRREALAPFLADVERARSLPPLTMAQARAVPAFGSRLDALLVPQGESVAALVTLSGVSDVAALAALAQRSRSVTLLDVKAASESLVAEQRERMLVSLAFGGVLLIAIVAVALRDRRRVLRVLAPLALTTLIVVAVLQAAGVSLNLFHLISLMFAAGLGLDYALFFEHAADDAAEQARTCTPFSPALPRRCWCSCCSRRRTYPCCARSACPWRSASSRISCSRCC